MPIAFKEINRKIISVIGNTTLASNPGMVPATPAGGRITLAGGVTANTAFTVAHGLGYTPTFWAVDVRTIGLDGTAAASYVVTAVDGTNITVMPSANQASGVVSFLLIIALDVDIGGRNFAR